MKKLLLTAFIVFLALIQSKSFAEEIIAEPLPVQSKFEAKLYGYIKLDTVYSDSQTYFGNVDFYVKSEPASNDNQFHLTINQTRIGLSVKAPSFVMATPEGIVEMDFYGGGNENTPNPRLYRGYIQLKWPNFLILAGQDWDTHSVLYPSTLNFAYLATAGNIQYRRPQLRLIKYLPVAEKSKLSFASAIARTIATDLDGNGKNDGDDAGWPTWEGRVAFESNIVENLPLTLAFSGHYGREEIDWDNTGSDFHYNSWSMNGELILPFWTYAYLKAECFYGRNLDAYYGGILQGINSITRRSIRAIGGWAELTLLPSKKVSLHLGGGIDHPKKDDINDSDKLTNVAGYGNIYYNFTNYLVGGFEYTYFRTFYKNAPTGDNNRFQASMILNF